MVRNPLLESLPLENFVMAKFASLINLQVRFGESDVEETWILTATEENLRIPQRGNTLNFFVVLSEVSHHFISPVQ